MSSYFTVPPTIKAAARTALQGILAATACIVLSTFVQDMVLRTFWAFLAVAALAGTVVQVQQVFKGPPDITGGLASFGPAQVDAWKKTVLGGDGERISRPCGRCLHMIAHSPHTSLLDKQTLLERIGLVDNAVDALKVCYELKRSVEAKGKGRYKT